MKYKALEHILHNPRPGIRYAVIHHYKGRFNLTVKQKSVPAKMLRNLHGPYKSGRAAKAAFSRMYQPAKYWERPKWSTLKSK